MFGNLSDRITASFNQLRGKGRLTEADVNATVTEIRRALLEADVALPVVRAFTAAVREKAVDAARSQALNPGQQVVKIVNEELIEVLGGQTREIHWADRGPTIIMLAGLQGAGKTTLAGKLGRWLRDQGKRVLLVASDLQRPNAVTQLSVVAERAGVTGVLAVELFAVETFGEPTRLYVNELAMRPHNSGHWTQDGSVTSQFAQHLRAVLDLPLGATEATAPTTVMVNLIGGRREPGPDALARAMAAHPEARIHLYGKQWRAGRKLGHVTMTVGPHQEVADVVEQARGAVAILRGDA